MFLKVATGSNASTTRMTISRSCRRVVRAKVSQHFGDRLWKFDFTSRAFSSSLPSAPQKNAMQSETRNEEERLPSQTVADSPIDFAISAKIEGEESQIATITLQPGERLRAESGAMLFMTKGIQMSTKLEGASSAFQRMMTGQNVFLTDFTYEDEHSEGTGTVALGTDFPSKIIRLSLEDHGGSLIAQRGAYLASNPSVDIQMEFTRTMTAGFFGGQGFILQRLIGSGDVLIKAGGTLVERTLEEGEVLRATSGSIVAFEPSVSYDIQMMQGVKNVMFGGEGLFVTALTGPGRIWLQGMPPDRMIAEIASRVPSGGGLGPVIPIGGFGGGGSDGGVDGGPIDSGIPPDGAGNAEVGSGEEMVAASDEGTNADQEPVLSQDGSTTFSNTVGENETFQETTFTDENTDFTEPSFSDETSFSMDGMDDGFQEQSGDFFDADDTELFDSGVPDSGLAEEASEAGSSILSTLWDIFTGD